METRNFSFKINVTIPPNVLNLGTELTPDSQNISNDLQDYNNFSDVWFTYIDWLQFAFCFLGIISSVLTLVTLIKNEHFAEPCFVCYIGLAVSELIYAIINIVYYWFIIKRNVLSASYVWVWVRYAILEAILSFCGRNSTCLVVFLSLQRFVACLIPNKYYLFNKKQLCVGVTIGTVLVSAASAAPIVFGVKIAYDNVSGLYSYDSYPFYKDFDDAINYVSIVEAALIFITTTLAIAGLVKAIILRYVHICKNTLQLALIRVSTGQIKI